MNPATTLDEWADKYGDLRRRGASSASAWLGIPLIVASLIGLLWSIPVPEALGAISPAVNFATLFLMATFVYYCILSISLALGGFAFLVLATMPSVLLSLKGLPLTAAAAACFVTVLLWHLIESKQATGRFLLIRNLQYLMLGPIWLLREAYRRMGLTY